MEKALGGELWMIISQSYSSPKNGTGSNLGLGRMPGNIGAEPHLTLPWAAPIFLASFTVASFSFFGLKITIAVINRLNLCFDLQQKPEQNELSL